MLITITSFDGHTLNDSSYKTTLMNPFAGTEAKPVFLEQDESDARDAGTYTVSAQIKVLSVKVKSYANRHALFAQLKTWFKRGTRGALVASFQDDGVSYQLTCRVINCIQDPDNNMSWTITLQTGESSWRSVSQYTLGGSPWVVTGTTEDYVLAVGGKDETYLDLDITATDGPANGYLFQNIYRLPNVPGIELGVIGWCITVNMSALTGAGKMQVDGDDMRFVNMLTGLELKRWIDPSTINTSTTKVWVILDIKKGFSLTLSTTVASSGTPAFLQFTVDDTTRKKISEMPSTGIMYHNNEWFYYTSKDAKKCRLNISKRALFGTTQEQHLSGVSFLYIQHPILMKYGNSSATAPALADANYDDDKPMFKLNSGNGQYIWDTTTKFYDPLHPTRPGSWKFFRSAKGPNSKVFYVKADAESGDPAIGFKAASYLVGSTWRDETVNLNAVFFHGAGISQVVTFTGDKYRSNDYWVSLSALRRSANNVNYYNLIVEASPSAAGGSPQTFSHSNQAVAAGTKYLQMIMSGGYKRGKDGYAYFEALTLTIDINTSNLPTGTFLGEQENFPLVLTAENITVGDQVQLDYMMLLNKPFALSSELQTATYDGVNVHSSVSLDDESRSVFLRLQGGVNNTIRISGADLGQLSVDLKYYRRRLA